MSEISESKKEYEKKQLEVDPLGFGIRNKEPFPGDPINLGIDVKNPIALNSEADINHTLLNELAPIISDIIQGDPSALNRPEYTCLNLANVRLAIDYLLQSNSFSDSSVNSLVASPWRLVYRARPPTPEEFLTAKFIGAQSESVWPHIKEAFCEIFDPTKPYRTVVLYPSIGTGKSFLSILCSLYVSTCVSLMWKPYRFFGQGPSTVYTQVYVAGSKLKSSELLMEPLINLIEGAGEFFIKVRTRQDMAKAVQEFENEIEPKHIYYTTSTPTSKLQFSGGMNYKLINSPSGLLGQTIITGTITEINFLINEGGWDQTQVYTIYTKLRQRIISRMANNYYSRFILDSSPNTLEDNPIEQWINEDAPKNKSNFIMEGARWKFFPKDFPTFKNEDGTINEENSFYLFKGGNGELPHVIDKGSINHYNISDLVQCPKNSIDISYEDMAKENPVEFMRDQIGLPTNSADKIFYNKVLVNSCFCHRLKNMYAYIEAPSFKEPEHLIWDQIRDHFFYKILDKYYFWYEPYLPRVVSVDQSITGDMTCIALSHQEVDPTKIDHETGSLQIIYVTDFVINVVPKGNRINLDAIRFFIMDLVKLGNIHILAASFDSFQSESSVQALNRFGIETQWLSVDKTNGPYLFFINMVQTHRWFTGPSIIIRNNLFSLQEKRRRSSDGKKNAGSLKVDHSSGANILAWPPFYNQSDPQSYLTSWEDDKLCLTGIHAKDSLDPTVANIDLLKTINPFTTKLWQPDLIQDHSEDTARDAIDIWMKKKGLAL